MAYTPKKIYIICEDSPQAFQDEVNHAFAVLRAGSPKLTQFAIGAAHVYGVVEYNYREVDTEDLKR